MEDQTAPQTFNATVVRRMWYQDTWYYSVIDVVAVLTEAVNPNRYWNTLKSRLQGEGQQISSTRSRNSPIVYRVVSSAQGVHACASCMSTAAL